MLAVTIPPHTLSLSWLSYHLLTVGGNTDLLKHRPQTLQPSLSGRIFPIVVHDLGRRFLSSQLNVIGNNWLISLVAHIPRQQER